MSKKDPQDEQVVDGAARRQRWKPAARPQWVAEVNEIGSFMDLRSVVPLDEASLLGTAQENTGLSDFGEDSWREPFRVFVKALEKEAQLNLMGRLLTRSELLQYLESRLQIENAYKLHPEIENEQINRPLLIIGQGRTGTSVLQNLLSADPENGTNTIWEAMFPFPPPEAASYHTDPRIERADKLITIYNRIAPELESMHEFSGSIPNESVHLRCLAFQSVWMVVMGQAPSYFQFMGGRDVRDALRYEKRVLKFLQWKNPRKRWVLKAPDYIRYLPEAFEVYPDAAVIWTHRDPIVALTSAIGLMGTLNWIRSDVPFLDGTLDFLTRVDASAELMTKPIEWLQSGKVPADRFCNVSYQDFVRDPMAVVDQIYARCGIHLTADRRALMQQHMESTPRSKRPAHKYDLGPRETLERERAAFSVYQRFFNVPDEV